MDRPTRLVLVLSDIIINMEIILLIVIVLQFFYMVYSDIQNRKEREAWALKVMSKNLDEYKSVGEGTPEDSPKQDPDPYLDASEVGIDRILEAKE